MQKHGGDIYRNQIKIDFSTNINPLGIPPKVAKAACEGVYLSSVYPDTECMLLTECVAESENVLPEQVLCGNGAADLIFRFVYALKPKKALLPVPIFSEYEAALRSVGCKIEYHYLQEQDGFQLNNEFTNKITSDLDLIFLCNPNNPTGLLISQPLLCDIVEVCRRKHVALFIDECFNDFLDMPKQNTMKEKITLFPDLFILKAFTKFYAIPGLRLGYLLTGNHRFLNQMRENSQSWSVSLPAQKAGIAALLEKEYAEQSRIFIQTEREYLKKELQNLGFFVYDSKANYLFFSGAAHFYEKCLEYSILIRDCSSYLGLGSGFYRIAVRTREENEVFISLLKHINHNNMEGR